MNAIAKDLADVRTALQMSRAHLARAGAIIEASPERPALSLLLGKIDDASTLVRQLEREARPVGYGPLDYRPDAIAVTDQFCLWQALLRRPPGDVMVRCRKVFCCSIWFDHLSWYSWESCLAESGLPYAQAVPMRCYWAHDPSGVAWCHSEYHVSIVDPALLESVL